jgi:8-oxo-dGTP pyrophosphatase MutT (NUDIX family)
MSPELTHAGAVAFRHGGDEALFLVVSSSDGRHWVLPKGHIKPGESASDCARRELREEAGVTGEVVAPLTRAEFTLPKETVRVQYFLVRELSSAPAAEGRDLEWMSAERAQDRLTFDDARDALRLGAGRVQADDETESADPNNQRGEK